MEDFMLVFRNTLANEEAFVQLSPDEMQAEMALWQKWMDGLARQGKLVGGQPLLPHGNLTKAKAEQNLLMRKISAL